MSRRAARSKRVSWGLVWVLMLASLSGVVCADEPGDRHAMQCEQDLHNCDMAGVHDTPTDCCKPDRTSKIPASVKTSFRDTIEFQASADVAMLPVVLTVPILRGRSYVFSASRGSPPSLANRPLDVPLLN